MKPLPSFYIALLLSIMLGCSSSTHERELQVGIEQAQAEQIPEDSIVGYKRDTEELSMYNQKYSLSIEIVEYLAPTKNLVEIILLNNTSGDTAIQKKISIDSVEQKYWRFNKGIERVNLTESYTISDVSYSFVRTENMYFDLILKSNDGDSIKTNLKFKYRGREKNALWVGIY